MGIDSKIQMCTSIIYGIGVLRKSVMDGDLTSESESHGHKYMLHAQRG